ncbi:hypothetical protein KGF57_000908 [Candida theae]|uniref:LSM12 anticodon-binding domain-containing protein n=1 Tax=Candida theae TaxID=1198502 RepID=A0AAD5G0H1_9ASCO|nr:uncharacterized protein KGF57_000908 [Candida theae]KAI5965115.1 hypothetical protein KGF57_000908 [Candida theae]
MSIEYQNLRQALSLKLKVTTLLDQEIVGFIYTFSSSNEVLVLITSNQASDNHHSSSSSSPPPPAPPLPPSVNQTNTYRIINTSFIKSIQVLNPPQSKKTIPKPPKNVNPVMESINVKDLEEFLREQIQTYNASTVESASNSTNEVKSHKGSSKTHKSGPPAQQSHAQQTSPIPQQHPQQHQQQNQHQQHRHQHSQKSIAIQLHDKLSAWFGSDNVTYGNQKRTEIIIHNDIKLVKPFTNTQKNVQVLNKQTKHLPALTRALKQFWDSIDNEKKGG